MMIFRLPLFLLAFTLAASAQNGDQKGARMDPVVPEELIPASPVLPVEDALKSFQIAPGFVIEPVAVEPLVEKPVCLDFDGRGRMWVCEMRGYMPDIDGKGESAPSGRIVILEDTDRDGKADKRTVFLDQLLLPRALSVFEDGLLFMDETTLSWVKRKGDMPEGKPVPIDSALLNGGNVEHKPNGLLSNLDNRLYLAKSGKRIRRTGTSWELESSTFRGQWGIARDDYGRLYHNNNSTLLFTDLFAPDLFLGNPDVKMKFKDFTQLGNNRVWPARVTPAVNRAYVAKSSGYESDTLDPKTHKLINATAAAGMAIYRGNNFPKEWYGTAFVTEPVCNLVKAIRVSDRDGKLEATHPTGGKEFLASTDERFRPVNAVNAPDGSLYILDMYHGIIQHKTYMTSYLRKQTLSRGLEAPGFGHGRIYRIRHASGKMETVPDIGSLSGLDLVKMLLHPAAWQRETAQRLLVERKDPATIPWLEKLTANGAVIPRIHAIWTLEGMGVLKADHLASAIRGTDAKLQSSALWASTRLDATELAKLSPALLAARPASPEVVTFLARALGPLGTPAAYGKLAEIVMDRGKAKLVREAAVSGLRGRETAFLETSGKKVKDGQLIEWLSQARGSSAFGTVAGNMLEGEELASFERGKTLFHGEAACFGCHGADGTGMPNLGPPLDESHWVTGPPATLVKILLHGMTGPVVVDGETYTPEADMPGLAMNPAVTDRMLADIATYVRNEWSNRSTAVSAGDVGKERKAAGNRAGKPWTAAELSR